MHALLERVFPEITADIDKGAITDDLVCTMLRDWQFSHGAQSMETVLRAMAVQRQTPALGLSDLPIQTQLANHVAVESRWTLFPWPGWESNPATI
ncbi:hypothetical protein [Roseovarius sp. D22-M7]|uniref:hypothetical protein n=1 Tax=Roseovarius sp. D22-M7 TaxID=3127116 RepID=UPI00300FF86D